MLAMLDEEEILRSYIESERYEAAQEAAKEAALRMLKEGKLSVEQIASYFSALSLDEAIGNMLPCCLVMYCDVMSSSESVPLRKTRKLCMLFRHCCRHAFIPALQCKLPQKFFLENLRNRPRIF